MIRVDEYGVILSKYNFSVIIQKSVYENDYSITLLDKNKVINSGCGYSTKESIVKSFENDLNVRQRISLDRLLDEIQF